MTIGFWKLAVTGRFMGETELPLYGRQLFSFGKDRDKNWDLFGFVHHARSQRHQASY